MSDVRASDAEREAVVDRLRDAAGEGRLDPDELAGRVDDALKARTHGELEAVTADLPQALVVRTPAPTPVVRDTMRLRNEAAGFLTPNLACIAVWAATGGGYFWPVWVLLGTGLGFGSYLISHVLGVASSDDHEGERQ